MTDLPNDPIDELVRRSAGPGAPASFKRRIHVQLEAERLLARRARVIRLQAAIAVAAVVVLALVIGLNADLFFATTTNQDSQPQARQDDAENSISPASNQPDSEKPDPQPEPPANTEPKPNETPDRPDPERENTPDPEPEPDKPEPTPEHKPDDVVKEPEPEPDKPDDVVEQPEIKEPEPTEVKPDTRVLVATLAGSGERLKVRYTLNEEWRDFTDNESLYSGVHLSVSRGLVDLELSGGGIARFDGDVQLTRGERTLEFALSDDSLYVDNLGVNNSISVSANGRRAEMGDGAGLFRHERNGLEVACLAGNLTLDGMAVSVDKVRKVTERRISDEENFHGDKLLEDIPTRLLARYDFDTAPPGGMYGDGEVLTDGVVMMDKAPRYIAFRHDETLVVLPGMVVRFRYRATDVTEFELEQFTLGDALMFKQIWKPESDSEWHVAEIRIEDIAEREDATRFPRHGDELRNFKLHFEGPEGARLELDWVEFIRVQDAEAR